MHSFRSSRPVRLWSHVFGHGLVVGQGLMLAAVCLCPSIALSQDDLAFEPYPVFVADQEAFARCGPSNEYYRTDPLRHGQELEVYAETDDGWLGIRPPDDSFCWIPAETVELDDAGETGIVIEDRTVAWIGTQLGRARTYRWQVQLAEGEPVTVVGRSERDGPDGPQLWLRIVPPSGEYRWVHRSQIVESSEALVATIRRQASPPRAETETIEEDSLTAADRAMPAVRVSADLSRSRSSRRDTGQNRSVAASGRSILQQDQRPVGSGLRNDTAWETNDRRVASADSAQPVDHQIVPTPAAAEASHAASRGGSLAAIEFLGRPRLLEIGSAPAAPRLDELASDSNWIAGDPAASRVRPVSATGLDASAGGAVQQAAGQQPLAATTLLPRVSPIVNAAPRVVSAERIAQIEAESRNADIERLSLIFSRLIAARAAALEIEPVERAARLIASSSLDAVAAGRARLLAERAEQYRRVANRRDGNATIQNTAATVAVTAAANVGAGMPVDSAAANQPTSHTGFLVQVYSVRANSPPFALTDDTGRTIAYVTPSPGVNLRTHLNSRIMVQGNPGFLTGLNTPHIMATQVARTAE